MQADEFTIPEATEKEYLAKDGSFFVNRVSYDGCRQYTSESVLTFGDDAPATASDRQSKVSAPLPVAGSELRLRLHRKWIQSLVPLETVWKRRLNTRSETRRAERSVRAPFSAVTWPNWRRSTSHDGTWSSPFDLTRSSYMGSQCRSRSNRLERWTGAGAPSSVLQYRP